MPTVQSKVKCQQCGFPHASEVLDIGCFEWEVICTRCGYVESWKNKSFFANGHLKKGVNEVIYAAGACCVKDAGNGIETHYSLTEDEIEKTAARMRADIAAGKLHPGSYVTKFDFNTGEVTAVVGHAPTHAPYEEDCELKEKTPEAEGRQEDEYLASEV